MSKTLKILSRPKGNAEEYGRWSVNPYVGCKTGCHYCYLKNGVWAKGLGGDKPQLKSGVESEEHAYHLAMAEIFEHREEIVRDGGLFMTFTSDPCAEETRDLFFRIVGSCITPTALGGKYSVIPCTLLTKNADFCGYSSTISAYGETLTPICPSWLYKIDVLGERTTLDTLAIGWTLTGHDELEPNASTNAERIRAMKFLSKRYNVWASIEPVIDFDSSYRMIAQATAAGCRHFKIGLLTNNTRVVRGDFSFGEYKFKAYDIQECCQFIGYVMEMTRGLATVYWKQSFTDFLQGPDKKNPQPVHGMTVQEFLHQWDHSVDKDWNMFKEAAGEEGVCSNDRKD